MLLGSDHTTGLLGAGNHQALIKRLDRVHIDDLGIDTIGSERLGSLKRLGDHKATSDDGHIGPLAHDHAATNLELIVLVIVNDRRCQASEAHVDRSLKLIGGAHASASLDVIGGNDYRHTRDRAHERDVLAALMRGAVFTDRDTRMRGTDFDVEVRIANGITHLFVRAAGGEHGKGARKGDVARGRNAGGEPHQVALGNAGIVEALRVRSLKLTRLRSGSQVGIEHYKVIVLIAQLDERLAVAYARGDFFDLCH